MNLTGNQKKMYLIALGVLAIAIILGSTWNFWLKPAEQVSGTEAAQPDEKATLSPMELLATPAPQATASGSAATPQESASGKTMRTIVYYQDNYGYLVPVMRTVPLTEGVAKATLGLMVQNTQNDMDAARLGLRTVLPQGASIDLDILSDGTCKVDLGKNAPELADAAAESNMVNAVVQTLTEFGTIKNVKFYVNGEPGKTLKYGTDISGTFARGMVNPESVADAAEASNMKSVMLYFPGDTASLIVPVTRMVYGKSDVQTAVLELAKGPSASSPLENALPAGCGLISATVENGVAKLNFTSEFIKIAEQSDGGRMCLKALVLTCTQFDGVKSVEIYVEGEKYDAGAETLAVPTFMNIADDIVSNVVQDQTAQLFDMD